jgi:hypothetical protein
MISRSRDDNVVSMKNFLANLLVVLIFFSASCATLGGNPGFVAFGACTTQTLETAGKNILNDIAAVFATGNYEAEVAKLIGEVGFAEVQCGIDLYIAEMSAKKSLTKIGATSLANAKAYRAAHPN